jgi:hypothetical protein
LWTDTQLLHKFSAPIRLTQTPTIYSMPTLAGKGHRVRIDKGPGQFQTVLKSGGGLNSRCKLNSEEV